MSAEVGAAFSLPQRSGESDEEKRLREGINRKSEELMKMLDAAICLRTAPIEIQRLRHSARQNLTDFQVKAMAAFASVKQGEGK